MIAVPENVDDDAVNDAAFFKSMVPPAPTARLESVALVLSTVSVPFVNVALLKPVNVPASVISTPLNA